MNEPECRFCLDNGLLADTPVHESDHFFVLLSMDRALPHAAMIIPRRHSETPFDMTVDEWAALPACLDVVRALLNRLNPDGFTLGWNVGPAAGQTVAHVHLHVIARFRDDPMAGKGLRHAFKKQIGDSRA